MELSYLENRIKSLGLDDKYVNTATSQVAGNTQQLYLALTSTKDKKDLDHQTLKLVLDQFRKEREDTTFSRYCLFCKKHFTGNRSVLLTHLMEQHNFFIGAPDNIVFVNLLLDHLENMLKELRCFYCEKVFKDWMVLKEHMRKKMHKQINPKNKFYDAFYLINYLEPEKSWIEVQKEDDEFESQDGNEKELMDWADDLPEYLCLFCDSKYEQFDATISHMIREHKFDFKTLKLQHNLDFYQQIKLINYIRKKVRDKTCLNCDQQFSFHDDLLRHLWESNHSSALPDSTLWDQYFYFFSTVENDHMLCGLDVDDSDCLGLVVYPEDTPISSQIFTYD